MNPEIHVVVSTKGVLDNYPILSCRINRIIQIPKENNIVSFDDEMITDLKKYTCYSPEPEGAFDVCGKVYSIEYQYLTNKTIITLHLQRR
jgi:hypothetical protein